MKRLSLLLSILLLFAAILVACGEAESKADDGDKEPEAQESEDASAKDANEDETTEENGSDEAKPGDVKESEVGKLTLVKINKGLDISQETGPFNINISAVQIAVLEPSEDFKEMFDGKDKTTIATIEMTVENTSEDDMAIYPDQGTLTTDTGKQANAEIFMSDEVGGDFFGKITKEGNVIFQIDGEAEDISELTLIIDAPHDTDLESVGEQVKLSLPLE